MQKQENNMYNRKESATLNWDTLIRYFNNKNRNLAEVDRIMRSLSYTGMNDRKQKIKYIIHNTMKTTRTVKGFLMVFSLCIKFSTQHNVTFHTKSTDDIENLISHNLSED